MTTLRFLTMHRAYVYDRDSARFCMVLSVPAAMIEDPLWAALDVPPGYTLRRSDVATADDAAGLIGDAFGDGSPAAAGADATLAAFAQHAVTTELVGFDGRLASVVATLDAAEAATGGLLAGVGDGAPPIAVFALPAGLVLIGLDRAVTTEEAAATVAALRSQTIEPNAYARFGYLRFWPGGVPESAAGERT
jgi:hypothetical protein